MKISKLYIRNFVTVMAIIIAAQVCIAALFRIVGGAAGEKNFRSDITCIAYLIREQIGGKSAAELKLFIKDLSSSWSSDIWVEDSNGNLITSNLDSPRPPFPEGMAEFSGSGILREPDGPPHIYLVIKNDTGGKKIFIRKKMMHPFFEDLSFIFGLGIITVIVALILFPISKKITVPLNKLTESANAISRGEFDIRVEETARDEVGELARAFNLMSGRVLQMINGTKELTANISHHIRSPLTRISVSVELMRDKIIAGRNKEAETMLSSIENEITGIVQLTENIIELIRVDIVHRSSDYSEICLTDIAAETSAKFSDLMMQRSITHSAAYSKIPVNIYGIRRDICELFDILYDNAVNYSPEGGEISLSINENGNQVTVTITNNCDDISGDILESVFEPFRRFAPEKIPGNGLGLAIAGRIVQNHAGSILAESDDKKFIIKIIFNKSDIRPDHTV